MRDGIRLMLLGAHRGGRRAVAYTGVGLALATTGILVAARVLDGAMVPVGGFLLLALMTLALVVGGYHAYRSGGLLWSLSPMAGVVTGVGAARIITRLVFGVDRNRGLGTVDVAVLLLGLGLVTVILAYGLGRIWRE